MNDKLTDLTILLDRSGSMGALRESMESALNWFITEQRSVPGDCTFTLAQFDDQFEVLVDAKPIAEVDSTFVLVPRGWTALNDAMARIINATGARIAAMAEKDRPSKVVVVIITDGQENASVEYSRLKVAEMVKRQEDVYQWKFIYLAANHDAIQEAKTAGIVASRAMNYAPTSAGVAQSFQHVNSNIRAARGISGQSCGTVLDFAEAARAEQDAMGAQDFKKNKPVV